MTVRIAVNAFNTPPHLAGIGYYLRQLYSSIAEDPSVESVCLFTNSEAASRLQGLHPKIEVRGYRLPGLAAKVGFTQFVFPFLLRKFDCVHSIGNVASMMTRKPQVVTVHDLCHRVMPERFGLLKRLYLDAGFFLSVRLRYVRFICVSASTERDLHRYYPRSIGRTSVVHSASKFPVYRGDSVRADLLFVGTLEPGKNLALALTALHALRTGSGPTPVLRVAGAKGWKQSGLPGMLQRLGLSECVLFLGKVDDRELQELYRTSLALVFPTRYEGFGLPILEAQSQGCIVIAAENSCMREIGGDAALYFEDNNAEALAAVIRETVENLRGLEGLREAGFRNLGRFGWDKSARETLSVLEACI